MTKANYLYCYALFDRLKKWSYHINVTVAEMRVQCTPNTIKITPKFGCSKTTHWKTKLDHQLCKVQTSLALQQISYTHVINNIQLILPVIKINLWTFTRDDRLGVHINVKFLHTQHQTVQPRPSWQNFGRRWYQLPGSFLSNIIQSIH